LKVLENGKVKHHQRGAITADDEKLGFSWVLTGEYPTIINGSSLEASSEPLGLFSYAMACGMHYRCGDPQVLDALIWLWQDPISTKWRFVASRCGFLRLRGRE